VLLRELLALELEYRLGSGDNPTPGEYEARFPGHTELVREILSSALSDGPEVTGVGAARTPSACTSGATGAYHPADTGTGASGAGGATDGANRPTRAASGRSRFTPLRQHAQGGLGTVSLAFDETLRRQVALKEIRPDRRGSAQLRQRFVAEAEITGQLEHPGIVPIYALEEDAEGQPYYAMRFIQGRTLAEAIQAYHRQPTPLAFHDLLKRFVAVCQTIAYVHSKGVIHRDLKPANVLLGDYGETLVVDWGLAKRVGGGPEADARLGEEPTAAGGDTGAGSGEALTEAGQVLGTPAYMSPEQAEGQPEGVGPATDVYALGAILYELLTGQPPYRGGGMGAVLAQVRQGPPPAPVRVRRGVPRALEAVCLKTIARSPGDRYAGAGEVAREVERWLADEPVTAYREPLHTRMGRWARRHKTAVASAGVLLLAAVVGLAAGLAAVNAERQRTEQARAQEAKRRQQAREALDAMFSEVIDDLLAKQKELTGPQKRFLERALDSYEEFAEDTGRDEQGRAGVAAAYRRVGDIRKRLGQMQQAEEAYRASIERYARLAADYPATADHREELAHSHQNLGNLFLLSSRPQDAESEYRAAIAVQQTLANAFPDKTAYRQALAGSYDNLALVLGDSGRAKEAEKAYGAALDLQQRLVKDAPDVPRYRQEAARSLCNLGSLLFLTGHLQDSEEKYRAAVKLEQELADKYPELPDYRQQLARSHFNLGNLLNATKRYHDAKVEYRAAVDLEQKLAADFPGAPEYARELAVTHNGLGCVLRDTGQAKEAEGEFRTALAVQKKLAENQPSMPNYQNDVAGTLGNIGQLLWGHQDYAAARPVLEQALPYHEAALKANPRDPVYTRFYFNNSVVLADCLRHLGAHAEADRATDRLERTAEGPGDLYTVAWLLSGWVPLAAKEATLPAPRRQELAREYAGRAMAALRKAVTAGYHDLDSLQKDPHLDPLRRRDDFNQLVAELRAAPPPAKPGP
jgi:serine/threonine-protein kinase